MKNNKEGKPYRVKRSVLSPEEMKAFVVGIQKLIEKYSGISDERLLGMIKGAIPQCPEDIINKGIRQARKFLSVQEDCRKRFKKHTFAQEVDDLVKDLARSYDCTEAFVMAALAPVIDGVAVEWAKKHVGPTDLKKDSKRMAQEICDRFLGGDIGSPQFAALWKAVTKKQEELRRKKDTLPLIKGETETVPEKTDSLIREDSKKPDNKVVNISSPKQFPTYVTFKEGTVLAAHVVTPFGNMTPLQYINSVSKYLKLDWAVISDGREFLLFKRVGGIFQNYGGAKKASKEQKKEVKKEEKTRNRAT